MIMITVMITMTLLLMMTTMMTTVAIVVVIKCLSNGGELRFLSISNKSTHRPVLICSW